MMVTPLEMNGEDPNLHPARYVPQTIASEYPGLRYMQSYEVIQLLCVVIENERSKTTVSNNFNDARNRHLAKIFSRRGVPAAEVADPDITMYMDSQAETVHRDGGESDPKPQALAQAQAQPQTPQTAVVSAEQMRRLELTLEQNRALNLQKRTRELTRQRELEGGPERVREEQARQLKQKRVHDWLREEA